jgi:hypothetical protein
VWQVPTSGALGAQAREASLIRHAKADEVAVKLGRDRPVLWYDDGLRLDDAGERDQAVRSIWETGGHVSVRVWEAMGKGKTHKQVLSTMPNSNKGGKVKLRGKTCAGPGGRSPSSFA